MEILMIMLFSIFIFFPLFTLLDLISFIRHGKRWLEGPFKCVAELVLFGIPFFCWLCFYIDKERQLYVGSIICLCLAAYFYSSWRKRLLPPVPEVIVNCVLLIGLWLNIRIAVEVENELFSLLCIDVPAITLFMIAIIINHQRYEQYAAAPVAPESRIALFCSAVLQLDLFRKIVVLALLSMIILAVAAAVLMLVGLKLEDAIDILSLRGVWALE